MQITFAELIAQLPPNAIYIAEDNNGDLGFNLSISAMLGEVISTDDNVQVIKLLTKLFNAGYKAQMAYNNTALPENQIASFEITGGSEIDSQGFITQTQIFKVKLLASSATEIQAYQSPPTMTV